ncbi:MAG: HD domain-containing protein [Elusimicrobia bacterium]|nr:HD domain-containing protein [Elusimicrobiota bacterium]
MLLNFEDIRNNEELLTYLKYADNYFESIGYKEHGLNHAMFTAERAADVLRHLGYTARTQELAKIAGFLHDIGNLVGRTDHAQSGAVIAMHILSRMDIAEERYNSDIFEIFGAIGSHEDKNMTPPTEIAAAVVLGDKTDVRYKRLRNEGKKFTDVHSKVIAACNNTKLEVNKGKKEISLNMDIDTDICSIMEYFEIFTQRTIYCSKACSVLKCDFSLYINGDRFL